MAIWKEIWEKRRGLWVFIPLVLLYAASYFQRTALPGTIYDTLTGELHLSAPQMANLSASFVYTYAFFQLISGSLVDRFCGTRVVIAGGIVFLAGTFLFPLCHHILLLYTARILTGIGASAMYLSLVREIDRLFGRKNYAVLFGIAYFCGYGGGLMGSLPFERLCAVFPWRNILLLVAFISLVIYIFVLLFRNKVPLPAIPRTPFSLNPFWYIAKNSLSWRVIICSGITFSTYFIIQTVFGKKFLQDFAGFSSAGAAAVIFSLTLVCMCTMLTTSFLTRLTGNRRRPWVLGACGLCAISSLLMVIAIFFKLPGWTFAVIYCLFAAAAGIPPIFAMVMQELNAKEVMAQSAAFSNMFCYLFVAIGAQLAGVLLDNFEITRDADGIIRYAPEAYLTLFIIVSGIALLSFAVALLIPETKGHYLRIHAGKTSSGK